MALALLFLLGQFGSGLFPDAPNSEGDAALQEEVEELLERGIDLNRASTRELLAIPWLNPFLAYRIAAVRDSVGGFSRVEQLRQVPGMTAEAFDGLRPFLRVGSRERILTGRAVSRAGSDSLGSSMAGFRVFNRLELESRAVRITALEEKDSGESSAFDFLSAGAEFRPGRFRLLLGDMTAGFGQGLVASASHWQSSLLDGPDHGSHSVHVASSALEGSSLRGGAVEGSSGNWGACVLGAYTSRDAKLNDDGSVNRLVGSGVHDDSTSLAGRNAVREATTGLSVRVGDSRTGIGLAAVYSKYNRTFAPSDPDASFAGDEVLAAGANAQWKTEHYELGAEVAGSSGRGLAGSFEMTGSWPDFDSRVAFRGRQARFFAPHGRWSSLTGTRDRLDASTRLGWHRAGSSVSVSGNTYRDFELDSVPARLEIRLGQELGKLDLALTMGLRYEAEQEPRRTAKAEVGVRLAPGTRARVVLADVYPGKSTSRGTLAALLLTYGLGSADLGVAAARIAVGGTGVTMYVPEPGAGRIGSSFSTSVSCWRLAAGGGIRLGRWLRLGLKAGCAWKPWPVLDGAAQLELHCS